MPDAPEVVTVTPNPALDWALRVPGFAPGAVNRVAVERLTPGGKGVNVAAALAALGVRVAATGLLGEANAEPFDALFARAGIADHFVRGPGATRVAIKVTDPDTEHTTDLNPAGRTATADDVARLVERVDALALGTGWFVLAGSVPPGAPPALHQALTERLVAAGRPVLLDTSGEPLRVAVEAWDAGGAVPAVLKPNRHELEALLGRPLPTRDAVAAVARGYVARGVELVAVSLGAEGALFVERDAMVLAHPPRVGVYTTVGAGDAMVAGIVAGRLRGLPLAEVARLATACALHVITRTADQDGAPAAVAAFTEQVVVEAIA